MVSRPFPGHCSPSDPSSTRDLPAANAASVAVMASRPHAVVDISRYVPLRAYWGRRWCLSDLDSRFRGFGLVLPWLVQRRCEGVCLRGVLLSGVHVSYRRLCRC
eukprot:1178100-Pleurochrysis_carterae.AAC.1